MRRIINKIIMVGLFATTSLMSYAKKNDLKHHGNNSYKNVISFEQKTDLSYWKGTQSSAKLSNQHFKHGKSALMWKYKEGASLVTSHPDIRKATESKEGGIKIWIYNAEPTDENLTVNVGNQKQFDKGNSAYRFSCRLNYKGWRAFWVHFNEDASTGEVTNNQQADAIEMQVSGGNGVLYMDNVEFVTEMSWKRSEDHFKVINNEIEHFGLNHPWEYTNFWSKQPVADASQWQWNEAAAKEIATIEHRYQQWVLGKDTDASYAPLNIRKTELKKLIRNAKERLSRMNIVRHKDGRLTGQPLYSIREGHRPHYAELSMSVLLQLALDYKLNGNQESLQDCFLILDYMRDQGWASGSALGTIDHELLRHAGYFHSIYLLRDELKNSGRLKREIETAKWYLNWNEMYNMPDYVGCTADFMRTVFMYRLLVIMSQEDGSEKLRDMSFYSQWINNSMKIAGGFADTFKPDFTGYHHRGIYMNAYSPGAYHLAAVVCYLLHDTKFKVQAEQTENLRQALITARRMNCKYSIPLGVCGRFPEKTENFADILPGMAYLLKVNPKDKELMGLYKSWWLPQSDRFKTGLFNKADSRLSFYHTLGAIDIMKEVGEMEGQATQSIDGHWFKPYAGLSLHRRDNWMVSAKGWSAYIWDFESGKGENVFGRYESQGALQFFTKGEPVSDRASGYQPDKGWDWSRIPGTTAIHLPLRGMEHRGGKTKAFTSGKHRNFTDQTFLAGVSSSNGNGIFANKIHDTAFDPEFWARKSVFFFNDLVVCLGDGIRSSNKEHDTETALFQIYDNGEGLLVNGAKANAGSFNSTNQLTFEAPDNNVYIIPKGQAVNYHYQEQKSISESGKGETQGRYYTAWINHGKAPKDAAYEYAVLVNGKHQEEKVANYKVLQKDNQAHIVQFENQKAYVVWDEEYYSNDSYLHAVSVPGVAMITDKGNQLELAFSDPDLRRPKLLNISGMEHTNVVAPSYAQQVRVTLNGKYKLKNKEHFRVVGYHQNTTILEVMCKDGATYNATLIKK